MGSINYDRFNMQKLAPSRRPVRDGDIFVVKMPGHPYLFGRVMRSDAKVMGMTNGYLIYIYRAFSEDKQAIPVLDKEQLLVPPFITNREAWKYGFFEYITHYDMRKEDLLTQHCFWNDLRKTYYDEYSREIPNRVEPCGMHSIKLILGIDYLISDALDIPRRPY